MFNDQGVDGGTNIYEAGTGLDGWDPAAGGGGDDRDNDDDKSNSAVLYWFVLVRNSSVGAVTRCGLDGTGI